MAVVDMIKGAENSVLGVWNPIEKYVVALVIGVGGSVFFTPLIGVPAGVAAFFLAQRNDRLR